MDTEFLKMEKISKAFPGVQALAGVSLGLRRGEVHALIGENGAGKSTLMNILGGLVAPDAGHIVHMDETITIRNPLEALTKGIGFVHQESNLLENLTVLENIFLGREIKTATGKLHKARMAQEVLRVGSALGYSWNPHAYIANLSLSQRQCVEIARALLHNPRILILDEPTAALDEDEVAHLFGIIASLKSAGVAILYISHRLDEVMHIADRVTVLKDGKMAGTLNREEISKERMISLMVGRVVDDIYPNREGVPMGESILKVENLWVGVRTREITFDVRAGEIVSLGGLEGQGQRAVLRAIFGDVAPSRGRVVVNGLDVTGKNIALHIDSGVAYLTHDRRGEGLVLSLSMGENCSLASLGRLSGKMGMMDTRRERREITQSISQMQIKTASVDQPVDNLSGGNQQKVMLSRWLMTKPRLLIVDEPTKGIDVGARMSLYKILDALTREGIAILMLTSDMMELTGLSDRILVFYEGRIIDEFSRSDASEEAIMRAASGMSRGESA